MTIKELEERTGMPRANIRFYEDEGLLKPKRLPNGYRDYSEEDILTLEKIKLLRQLQLDINTIRLVQEGTLSLEQAMFSQLNRLEGDRAAIERAAEVCRGIERSRVEYGALEPKTWLRELEAPARPQIIPPTPKPEPKPEPTELEKHYWTHRAYDHPWMRFFARGIDFSIYKLLFMALFLLVFRWHGYLDLGWFAEILFNMGIYCVGILVEPLWLHCVGWTPGKWIFGLKLRDKNGNKLSLSQARSRAWQVAWQGDGLQIPFYSLWRNWKSYKCCRDEGDCPWDVYEGCMYTREDRKLYGIWLSIWYALWIALTALVMFGCLLPPHLNGLTVSEYSKNYNDRLELYEKDSYDTLTTEGSWKRGSYPYEGESVVSINGGPQIEVTGSTRWLDPQFTVEDGEITAVTFVMESDRTLLSATYNRELFGFLAFTGALDGLNLFNYDVDAWTEEWQDLLEQPEKWENFEFTCRGIRVTQTVENHGYEPYGYGSQLAALDTDNPSMTRTVTFSLSGSEVE